MTRARMPNPFDFGYPLPTSAAVSVPSTHADQATARVGDAPVAVAAPHQEQRRFVPDMNRLYLDIVSMPDPDPMPLFLRKPFKPRAIDPIVERSASRRFVETLIKMGQRD